MIRRPDRLEHCRDLGRRIDHRPAHGLGHHGPAVRRRDGGGTHVGVWHDRDGRDVGAVRRHRGVYLAGASRSRSGRHERGGRRRCAARDAATARPARCLRRRPARHAVPGRRARPVAHLRAEQQERHRHGDRPGDVRGDRDLSGRARAAARGAVVGPAHAVGERRPRQQPHPDRPADRTVRAAGVRARPVQPLLHAERAVRRGHGQRRPPARLPRPADDGGAQEGGRAVPGRQPRRLLPRRAVLPRQLRVLGPSCSRSTPSRCGWWG